MIHAFARHYWGDMVNDEDIRNVRPEFESGDICCQGLDIS